MTAVWTHAVVLFICGSCIGSFLNVVVYRMPHGLSLLRPPSFCPRCSTPIRAYDNLPILGWLLLGGKARCCGAPISGRYPLVEGLTGILWAIAGALHAAPVHGVYADAAELTLWLTVISMLVAAAFIDIDHQYLPDEITLGGCALGLLASAAMPWLHADAAAAFPAVSPHWVALLYSFIGMLAGLGATYAFTLLGNFCFREKIAEIQKEKPDVDSVLGLGDVKLMGFFGALFGWQAVPVIFLLGAFYGGIGGSLEKLRNGEALTTDGRRPSVWERLRHRWQTGDSIFPFGPYLCAAALTWLFARPALTGAAEWWWQTVTVR